MLDITEKLVTDPAQEVALTAQRKTLLQRAWTSSDGDLDAAIKIAMQCWLNEYSWWISAEELLWLDVLQENFLADLNDGEATAFQFAVLSCYRSLLGTVPAESIENAPFALQASDLIQKTVTNAKIESAIAVNITALTPIVDDVSISVRAQYEANPYPRWTKTSFPPPRPKNAKRVLVAGCGTGHQLPFISAQFPEASILAVDLSLASLAYAKRQTQALGLSIEYAQADILQIPETGLTFDAIISTGVLHHMTNPVDGLRALTAVLDKNGYLRIALYHKGARAGIRAAREMRIAGGYESTPEGIRNFRRDLIARCSGPLRPIACSIIHGQDFASTSMCRDLVFHVMEHDYNVQEAVDLINSANLVLEHIVLQDIFYKRYVSNFLDDPAVTNLRNLTKFEVTTPDAFAQMIDIEARK